MEAGKNRCPADNGLISSRHCRSSRAARSPTPAWIMAAGRPRKYICVQNNGIRKIDIPGQFDIVLRDHRGDGGISIHGRRRAAKDKRFVGMGSNPFCKVADDPRSGSDQQVDVAGIDFATESPSSRFESNHKPTSPRGIGTHRHPSPLSNGVEKITFNYHPGWPGQK